MKSLSAQPQWHVLESSLTGEEPAEYIKKIAAHLRPQIRHIVQSIGLQRGKFVGLAEFECLNPNRKDSRTGSFSINCHTGEWADFALENDSSARGSDVVSFYNYVRNIGDQLRAARELASMFGIPDFNTKDEWLALSQPEPLEEGASDYLSYIPDCIGEPPTHALGAPNAVFTYRDFDGLDACYVYRWEANAATGARKQFRPLTPWDSPTGPEWRWKMPPVRPLYNLHLLKQYPQSQVLFCEGEKAADAALAIHRGAAVSIMGGASSAEKADYALIRDRDVLIWPDKDEAGKDCADAIAKQCRLAGAKSVSIIDLSSIEKYVAMPRGGDAADAVAAGITAEQWESIAKTCMPTDTAESMQVEFDEPTMFGCAISTPEILTDVLPAPLDAYARQVADNKQVPAGMVVLQILAVVAAAVQGKVRTYVDADYWEPASIWTLGVLPPGGRKSAVNDEITKILTTFEASRALDLQQEINDIGLLREINLDVIKELKRSAAKPKISAEDRAAMIAQVQELHRNIPEQKHPPRYVTNDCTNEELATLMSENSGRISIISDEAGILKVASGLYSNGRSNVDIYLKGHAGTPVSVDRRGRERLVIEQPALTIGLMVQNEILEKIVASSNGEFRSNGFMARFLYCVPKVNIGKRKYRDLPQIDQKMRHAYEEKIVRLLRVEVPALQTLDLRLSQSARELYIDFAEETEGRIGEGGDLESIRDWAPKLGGASVRIASLFHCLKNGITSDALEIDDDSMQRAIRLCRMLIPHALSAFNLITTSQDVQDAQAIAEKVIAKGDLTVKKSDLWKLGRFTKGAGAAQRIAKALEQLADRQIMSKPIREGRAITFKVNPKVFELYPKG